MSSFSSFFSSFFPSAECEAPQEDLDESSDDGAVVLKEESSEEGDSEEDSSEEEELQDPLDTLREDCKEAGACSKFTQHFAHCQERVDSGDGFKGEDCIEEMFHMMHCVDNCVAPRLFAQLK